MEGKTISNNNCFFCCYFSFFPFSLETFQPRCSTPKSLRNPTEKPHTLRETTSCRHFVNPLSIFPPIQPKTTFQRNSPPPWEPLGSTFEGTTDFGRPLGSMWDARELGWRPGSGLGRLVLVLVHLKGGLLSRRVCSQPPAHARATQMGRGAAKELLCPPRILAARCSGRGAPAALPFQRCKVFLNPCPAANAALRQFSAKLLSRQSPPLPTVPGAEPMSGCRAPGA